MTIVTARSTAIEPRIANAPTARGNAAASKPPNTQTSTTKLSGIAMDSINSRSFSLWLLICTYVIATPPACMVTPSRSCTSSSVSSSACFWASLSPPVMPATIRPVLPSLLISAGAAGGGAVQAEVTPAHIGGFRQLVGDVGADAACRGSLDAAGVVAVTLMNSSMSPWPNLSTSS